MIELKPSGDIKSTANLPLAIDQVVLEAIPAAIYACAADGTIVWFNRSATELWGRSPKVGDTFERFAGAFILYQLDGTLLPHADAPMEFALRSGQSQRDKEVVVERPDGSRIVVLINIEVLKGSDGQVQGAINCFLDVTDRRRAEAARELLVSIVESSDDAIVSKDLEGKITSWNPGAERLFGYTAEEVVGRSIMILIPTEREHEEERILESIRRGQRVAHYDTVRRCKDGRLVDISLAVSPVKDVNGRIVGASKIARDITQRKRSEELLARHVEEQATLYDFTDRLHRARSWEGVYNASLTAIQRALQCRRASIRLFDETGTMKFVAWNGLSEAYRRVAEGFSPWPSGVDDPEPVCIGDTIELEGARPFSSISREEGVAALAFIPLVTKGGFIGAFESYRDAAHDFTDKQMELAVTIARQLGFSIERMRAEEAHHIAEKDLRNSEAVARAHALEVSSIMGAVPAVTWIARDPDCHLIIGNPFAQQFLRLSVGQNQSLSAPEAERPKHFEARADGRVLASDELPVQRAARGEEIRDFEFEIRFDDGMSRYLFGNATPLRDAEGTARGAVAAFVDITDRKNAETQRDLLVAELNHRVKNMLAIVIAIARKSFSTGKGPEEALRVFEARLQALARTHSRMSETTWSGASFEALLKDELAPYLDERGIGVGFSGPPIKFNPKCAMTLGMTIHELVTNAAKHGALSKDSGSVDIVWNVDPETGVLKIRWTEKGGPRVRPPERRGFGRFLLERGVAYDLGGEVQLDFAEEGLKCVMTIPLDQNIASLSRDRCWQVDNPDAT